MNVLEAIKTRRTIRKYEEREVPREALLRVLEAATWAPSHHDSQPWEFHLLTGEKIRALSSIFTRIRGAELEGSDMPPAKKEARMEFARTLGGAPLLVAVEVVVADEEVEMEERMQAVAAAIQNLALAACAEGLGTMWQTGSILRHPEILALLGRQQGNKLAGIILLGYPAVVPDPKPRIAVEQKMHW